MCFLQKEDATNAQHVCCRCSSNVLPDKQPFFCDMRIEKSVSEQESGRQVNQSGETNGTIKMVRASPETQLVTGIALGHVWVSSPSPPVRWQPHMSHVGACYAAARPLPCALRLALEWSSRLGASSLLACTCGGLDVDPTW